MSPAAKLLHHYATIRARLWAPSANVLDDGGTEHPRKVTLNYPITPPEPTRVDHPTPPPVTQPPPDPLYTTLLQPKIRPALVLAKIRKVYDIKSEVLMGSSRIAAHVLPRHIAFYLIHTLCDYSKNRIGHAYGYDHTTVMHGIRRIERFIANDPVFAQTIAALEGMIRAEHQYRLTLPPECQ